MTIYPIIIVLFYIFAPILILLLCHRYKFVNKLGSVVIAYIIGLILGNSGILPENVHELQETLTILTIPIAIPLLLFSANIKSWLKLAGKAFLSMLLAISSVIVVIITGFFVFRNGPIDDIWKIGGMLVGVYSGGTPNLASLKLMLDVDAHTYIITHTYDMILSSIYLLFILTIGQRLFNLFLPKYKRINNVNENSSTFDGTDPYTGILKKEKVLPLLAALGISILIFGIAGVTSLFVPENSQMVVVILIITSMGIGFAFIPAVNKIDKTFELGMYFILIFSLVVASMADITMFTGIGSSLFYYISLAVFGTLILHVFLSKVFKIDTDTVIITSSALICSPPFVPVVAGALKNREVIISGLTVGIIGYAAGNYLGFFMAQFLKGL